MSKMYVILERNFGNVKVLGCASDAEKAFRYQAAEMNGRCDYDKVWVEEMHCIDNSYVNCNRPYYYLYSIMLVPFNGGYEIAMEHDMSDVSACFGEVYLEVLDMPGGLKRVEFTMDELNLRKAEEVAKERLLCHLAG